ncbi:MAG: DUF309 domain-containing protein [Anaerolineae bacterium]
MPESPALMVEGNDLSAFPEAAKSRLLLQGLEEFNRGEFISCHESLERLWVSEPGSIRELYKGILQISVAFYHLREQRYRSAVMLLGRGAAYLEPFSPRCMGVEISMLLDGSARCLAELKRLGPNGLERFDWSLVPTIEMRLYDKADTQNEQR